MITTVLAAEGDKGNGRRGRSPRAPLQSDCTSIVSSPHGPSHQNSRDRLPDWVADDDDRPPQLIGPEPRQWKNARDELELVEAMDIAAIHIDHAVAVIEGDCRPRFDAV